MATVRYAIKKILLPFTPQCILIPWERHCDRKRMKVDEKSNREACLTAALNVAQRTGRSFTCKNKSIEICDGNNRIMILSSTHLIYLNDFIQMFDYFFNMVEPEAHMRKGKGFLVVDYSKECRHKLKTSGLSFYFTSMAESLEMSEGYLRNHRPKEGDTVVDCGAYCGTSAYVFSKMVGPSGRVYSLEPDKVSYRMLLKNINEHNLKNVVPLNMGLWSSAGTLGFHADGSLGAGVSSVLCRPFYKKLKSIKVMSLKDFCKEYQIPKGSMIKMDIEGAEIEVVKGSLGFIRENEMKFAIASYHIVDGEMTYLQLENMFSVIGYKTFSERTFDGQDNGSLITYAYR